LAVLNTGRVKGEGITEICSIGIMMGGGPVLTHMAEVERALNEFYLDDEGEEV